MDCKFIEKKKKTVEMEFADKEIPVALAGVLSKNGVDAYYYDPHPLKPGVRLHIDDDDAQGQLKKAITKLDSDWSGFRKSVQAKLK